MRRYVPRSIINVEVISSSCIDNDVGSIVSSPTSTLASSSSSSNI
eukprot:CAMPEP_0181177430 /NCGR_PEP_ID=MMETSP1096-20121128/5156_1 /TAXON_ID=156174 ORGANISM="Chrysochromulina ericina, Strain CCMP281" /NCGR_SAMPLE_ID=MMETSP1096 /ASSEMBLY_ACC=CAM_ASM_000453 /LENGTH=44 /DNA_ID= /DNA_START= /DNA_END= /DNA_ORIENTATION=